MIRPDITQYRPCVGLLLLNPKKQIWIGRRFDKQNDDGVGKWWQMPQGGVDPGEDLVVAARRELYEETGIRNVTVLGQTENWISYDLPDNLIGRSWGGRYRGQKQKWFALDFDGPDQDVNLQVPGQTPEFDAWRWASRDEMTDLIIPFKRGVYAQVLQEFSSLL